MLYFSTFLFSFVAIGALLPLGALSLPSTDHTSPVLAGPIGKNCTIGSIHEGTPTGKNITIGGVPTYFAAPSKALNNDGGGKKASTKVIMFFGAFSINNELLQDYFATQGYNVLGIDYFFGDPIGLHVSPDLVPFDPTFDLNAWVVKSKNQADAAVPTWIEAVKRRYGSKAKYTAVGYCFGAPYVMDLSATNQVVAGAFAHPSSLTEDHFNRLKKPLLLSCAESDSSFPNKSRRRAEDILAAGHSTYHVQIFSGTTHGFATRGNLTVENELWAKEESARSVIMWFDRFSK
ncbi:Alpha/Beta hydrolase protein [Ephemerocybe angulata]|uniref:Alpha/Beta hydrolase protein n=1 Tax=Ephemerocybe angulata TaxID=980116 RepID=A0A8H6LUQ2_9AGAR|nr:Alpha/Beta hydrolase protein [Tulosesus angulatus]